MNKQIYSKQLYRWWKGLKFLNLYSARSRDKILEYTCSTILSAAIIRTLRSVFPPFIEQQGGACTLLG